MEFKREDILENIKDWAYTFIGEKFEFREYQLDTIANIILNILNQKNKTQLIEAPTGSGKSLINIIAAGVLAEYYDKTSYILVSDLFLWKQYEDFINQHYNIKQKFGVLKGQTGNYQCAKNGEDMRNAECRMGGVSWAKLFNSGTAREMGYDCAVSCPYVKARKKALRCKVVIMTYQLYHFMINVVSKWSAVDKGSVFKKRDTIFCDECHNIPQIVKNNFTPEVKYSDFKHLKTLHSYLGKVQLDLFEKLLKEDVDEEEPNTSQYTLINKQMSLAELETKYDDIWNVFIDEHASGPANEKAENDYLDLLCKFSETVVAIESNLQYKSQVLRQPFNKDDLKFYKSCSWYRNVCCFWNDFHTCLAYTGQDYIIKTVEENRLLKETVVSFTNVKEDFLSYYFLLDTADNQVMLSATIGGYEAFAENAGFKFIETSEKFGPDEEIEYNVIPSTFDFEKSPIYFLNRYKMSYREKEQSLKSLKPIIYKMCEKQFPNERGMIQTGSYANAKEIYDNAPVSLKNRMLLYNNSKEKTQAISIHQMSQNTILIGPTLVEGIDLPGDQCRFIVILKVPYPVITDEYVKKKLELFPLWYNSSTSNIIIQGIGRGNRFKEDYCTTYILDACFLSLYNATKNQYPKELQQRIKIYT